MPPFDPNNITPQISLNRVRLIDLPGLVVDSQAKNKTGYELISSAALSREICGNIDVLQLNSQEDDHSLRLAFNACLTAPDPAIRAAAESVSRRLGRNLGYLLLTLKRGDAINQAARDEWDSSYWDFWSTVQHVWFGGGMLTGDLGIHIHRHACEVISEAEFYNLTVDVSPYAASLPLVGAARYAPANVTSALIFDFGSTMIKRAVATYDGDGLASLRRLPSIPTKWGDIFQTASNPAEKASQLFERAIATITQTKCDAQYASDSASETIIGCLAAYVKNGHPLSTQAGAYMQLRRITGNLQHSMEQRLAEEFGAPTAVTLIHDGTAAATTYAGQNNSAVITIGTALGVGFPPENADLCPITPDFTIENPALPI